MKTTTARRALPRPDCSISRSLEVLRDRWTLLILREALMGTTRFRNFHDVLGISTDLLSERLADLVEAGVMVKVPYREPGERARHAYQLTPAGEELRLALAALQQWGDTHRCPDGGPTAERRSRSTDRRVSVAFVDESGAQVPVDDVDFVLREPGDRGERVAEPGAGALAR
jgi:DNA-binding HxlR family transcriptional regulator